MLDDSTYTEAARRQVLGEGGLLGLLALLSAFVPLSTDMYLPALPSMTRAFGTTEQLVNLTLVLFFVFYSIGTLLWGPLSDKYGRKPVLFTGLALYIAACLGCALSANIYQLIAFRVLQAIGGGAAPAIAVALVKDLFHGHKREKGLALIQSMVMIAPIVAPLIGAMLLKFVSWQGVFLMLGGFGVAALVWSLALRETVTEHYTGTVTQTLGQLVTVLRNLGFTTLVFIFSLIVMPLYAYLAASSFIYEHEFGLTPLQFSYFFTANALCAVVAPLIYLQVARRMSRHAIITTCCAIIGFAGASICTLGLRHPLLLACSIMPATLAMGVIRPPSAHLMLEQQHGATGAVSSLINCLMSLMGSLGMLLMSWPWRSMIVPLGVIHLASGILCGVCWFALSQRSFIRQIPQLAAVQAGGECCED